MHICYIIHMAMDTTVLVTNNKCSYRYNIRTYMLLGRHFVETYRLYLYVTMVQDAKSLLVASFVTCACSVFLEASGACGI